MFLQYLYLCVCTINLYLRCRLAQVCKKDSCFLLLTLGYQP